MGVNNTILGICQFRAIIGYKGVRKKPVILPNLRSAETDALLVSTDLTWELKTHRLRKYPRVADLLRHYTISPLGQTDKFDGSKRPINHLSYPPAPSKSINAGIPEKYGTSAYSSIANAISAVLELVPKCILIK